MRSRATSHPWLAALGRRLAASSRFRRERPRLAAEDVRRLRAFAAGRSPDPGFHHADHVRLARLYLMREPPDAAVPRFCRDLARFAAAQGVPDRYHETVTRAFVLLVAERMARSGTGETWEAFAERHPDLLRWKPSLLERYYRRETLDSAFARAHFVLPDRGLEEPTARVDPGPAGA